MCNKLQLAVQEFLNTIKQLGELLSFNVVCGIVAIIVTFVVEIKYIQKHKVKDKRKEEAIRKGHVIKAKRIKMWYDKVPNNVDSYYHAKYEYEVSGKSYIYRYMGKTFPPYTISLYYKNNPRRVWDRVDGKRSPFRGRSNKTV